jgi:hypothetical protein
LHRQSKQCAPGNQHAQRPNGHARTRMKLRSNRSDHPVRKQQITGDCPHHSADQQPDIPAAAATAFSQRSAFLIKPRAIGRWGISRSILRCRFWKCHLVSIRRLRYENGPSRNYSGLSAHRSAGKLVWRKCACSPATPGDYSGECCVKERSRERGECGRAQGLVRQTQYLCQNANPTAFQESRNRKRTQFGPAPQKRAKCQHEEKTDERVSKTGRMNAPRERLASFIRPASTVPLRSSVS